ncbi:MAG: cytochrome c oxidase subunit II [Geminicoccaceae bacterium]|nr:cytochrome c oxidase subunit II [Geminicoccaceae bacterium]MCS7266534.1 cytochrome c oxidase subunit II [Geminicoccaceae bacterium]MCX7628961.1 cytochrome c oxidase subunit II [Geminicoccaceae bacterium]MDW8123870.1 cytochrome c oxidase subunit II [Geminicoccaceae bacterium]MDW8340067.1 cytochrome c oxidase subunit II [Geminicoccaceae bacterium]
MMARLLASVFALSIATVAVAHAAAPEPWQLGLQPAATPIMERIASFHELLFWIITFISLFVLALLLYASWRFREDRNPVPSRVTHNTLLEVVWTAVPVLILVIIAVPSFKLLYYQDVLPKTEMTIKAIGKQWLWTYEYPDHGNFTFDALMLEDHELKPGQKRLLETDNVVVLPTQTYIKVQVTATDVIHAWTVPAFGVKIDAVPGRLNEVWLYINEPGTYYGQCSELCGLRHGFMPIAVKAVPKPEFEAWVVEAQKKYARAGEPVRLAAAPAATR